MSNNGCNEEGRRSLPTFNFINLIFIVDDYLIKVVDVGLFL